MCHTQLYEEYMSLMRVWVCVHACACADAHVHRNTDTCMSIYINVWIYIPTPIIYLCKNLKSQLVVEIISTVEETQAQSGI